MELALEPEQLTRFRAVFAVHGPYTVLRVSEALEKLQIFSNDTLLYDGRAVVASQVATATGAVCEVTLEETGWLDVNPLFLERGRRSAQDEFRCFLERSQRQFRMRPEFKLVVAEMETFLRDLQQWLDQVELTVRTQPTGARDQFEHETLEALREPALAVLHDLFGRFEEAARDIGPDLVPEHAGYVKRQLHPLVLCAPFMHRTFRKPLGYAGDYEMVNMMTRSPYEGGSIYAKLLNAYFLDTSPVVAHRHRLELLERILVEETCRAAQEGRRARFFNLGCGPAKEIQDFVERQIVSDQAEFTLLDFNDETLEYTRRELDRVKRSSGRRTTVNTVRKSVVQLLKEVDKPTSSFRTPQYDVAYCAGLFDYLTDPVCTKLVKILYDMLRPGGLAVV
ncbi:MAG TPA: class I SAM-dependent methyltransferase, partial [Methylomirabilota bacterium]|nr:class I SAM-dependent methyltransferase [Methylomirabilota bacterium]